MHAPFLIIHHNDNVGVALRDLSAGQILDTPAGAVNLEEAIPAKHKFTLHAMEAGAAIYMYGVLVGKTTQPVPAGGLLTTRNLVHAAGDFNMGSRSTDWVKPDVSRFEGRTFRGFHREDGRVGTRNFWLVVPLVFCENRNIQVIREAMTAELGYLTERQFAVNTRRLVEAYRSGADAAALLEEEIILEGAALKQDRVFPQVDGIKFLTHQAGCGGTREDAMALCQLLAGYIAHPNVAGATVLSLGCQHAQVTLLQDALQQIAPNFDRPLYILEQQQSRSERQFIAEAVKKTFVGLIEANKTERTEAPLSKLTLGLECGGSDGFSGISANPALGHASDILVALGGTAILAEFPELNGVEQELLNRCKDEATARKFYNLMQAYAKRAAEVGSGFDMNPSPGNIRDGLITDAIKSAGAAKKGGASPVAAVLDYTEQAMTPGLNLLCTPGNDVESTTGLAGSGANVIVFTTGLGTPTGNPITPTLKMSTNTVLAERMPDLIDIDAGTIITGTDDLVSKGEELLELIIEVANGSEDPKAMQLQQDDFIPWKRGVSL
ncbi:MAG: altronate dehydratase family protein [Phaeodactylibacter sp.]|uniref:UxaA family hydrolase n=1 Tax=Phaeodactylibacter sp. TaxID=1940289 RepID=UPI0032EBB510